MHLIFLHGVPGVGKHSVAEQLAARTGFRLLDSHHLAALLGPVLGFSTPAFNTLRDATYARLVELAAEDGVPGLVATCIFEPSIPLERFRGYLELAARSGGAGVFVGLCCERADLRRRVEGGERRARGKLTDPDVLERSMDAGVFDVPELPGPSFTVDSTGLSVEATVETILRQLPEPIRAQADVER